ncbi:hypothetical protein BH23VER1_BH23VER1_34620 [soil metagenome]
MPTPQPQTIPSKPSNRTRPMKILTLLTAALAIGSLGLGSAAAAALKAAVTFKGRDTAETWFVVKASTESVSLSASPTGAGARDVAASSIESIAFEQPEGWDEALAEYDRRNFKAAAQRFGTIADALAGIAGYRDSFGARARYLQMESLRQVGDFDGIAAAMKTVKRSPIALGDAFQTQLKLYDAWAAAGDKDWNNLLRMVSAYEAEKPGGDANPSAPPFQDQAAGEFVQLVYLRGLARAGLGSADEALNDFYRAATLNFGVEQSVAALATLEALEILKARATAEKPDPYAQKEGHSLAVAYRDRFGNGEFPEGFGLFEKAPAKPEEPEA